MNEVIDAVGYGRDWRVKVVERQQVNAARALIPHSQERVAR